MGGSCFFFSVDKSFEIKDISEGQMRWFLLSERSSRFSSKITIDESNLRWVCNALQQASRGSRNLYRRWGRKQQNDLHRVYQNYNVYGRFLRVETWRGDRKSAIIIPEADSNLGWSEIASKILRFLGKPSNPVLQRFTNPGKIFLDAACKQSWPDLAHQDKPESTNLFLSCSLVGTFNDPFKSSPKSEVIQTWFLSRWKITAGLRVGPISHNQFLFELPSRQEAERVKMGEWFWNGRRLTIEWWSPVAGTQLATPKSAYRWIRAFGIPLNAWSEKTMKFIGDSCGGYVDTDKDTKKRNHLYWARICITDSTSSKKKKVVFEVL
ncbi:hypothetical protein FXO37_07072 [Capsicum annuum]|nr:hypothetical protein FXO37_07072 [Capsicum annuum]